MDTLAQNQGFMLAQWQKLLPLRKVKCLLCPHECILRENETGICRTRTNIDGQLATFAYSNPCSFAVDPIEKKPLFHFLPGSSIRSLATAGCNFRCRNCQNWQISQSTPDFVRHFDFSPGAIVDEAMRQDAGSIAFTYTEPTVFYEYMADIMQMAHERALKTVLISNGYINEKPLAALIPNLTAANIDLKCFDDSIYRRLCGGRLQPVLNTLKLLKNSGVWLEITNLIIPGYSDNPTMLSAMSEWLAENGFADVPLHFSRFFPTYKLQDVPPTSEEMLIQARNIAEKAGMRYVYLGNASTLCGENTYCPSCKYLLVERVGYRILKNDITPEGKCPFCGESIAGVWH